MKKAICKLKSITPVTFGRFHQENKLGTLPEGSQRISGLSFNKTTFKNI